VTPLTCDRVAMAGGVGVCGATTIATSARYGAKVFDPQFGVQGTVSLVGALDRVRVSPDGRWAAVAVSVPGDSEAEDDVATRATIINTAHARDLGNVGGSDGAYRCVTFTSDSDRFYAIDRER
jgi:hypothetical protein